MVKMSLVLLIALVSGNAFASKARLLALSQGENGSLYVDDARNVFLNPAKASKYGQWANFEWGSSTTPSDPNAEGGMFYNLGPGYLGLQLGRESNAQARITTANAITGSSFAFISPQNTVNVLYAGQAASMNWGVQLLYGSSQDNAEIVAPATSAFPNKKASTFEVGGGVEGDNFDAYGKIDLAYTSDNEVSATLSHKLEGKPTIELGGSYSTSDANKLYAQILTGGFDAKHSDNSFKKEAELFTFLVGWAHYLNPEAATRFYISPAFEINNVKIKDGNGGAESKTERQRIPLTIGMEMAANDWLALRASVTQKVLLDSTKTTVTDSHNPNTTTVGAGAGITWKKLTLDGTLRGAIGGTAGQLDGDDLLGNVGMTYVF
jgi:hypothetical protein